jgi:hypothetical protein
VAKKRSRALSLNDRITPQCKPTPYGCQELPYASGGDAALIGTLYWIEQEFGWRADWCLVWQGDHRRQIRGVNFDTAFRSAMGGSAQILSGHGEPK